MNQGDAYLGSRGKHAQPKLDPGWSEMAVSDEERLTIQLLRQGKDLCPKCHEKREQVPCPDGLDGCLVYHVACKCPSVPVARKFCWQPARRMIRNTRTSVDVPVCDGHFEACLRGGPFEDPIIAVDTTCQAELAECRREPNDVTHLLRKKVAICGSTRFIDVMAVAAWEEEKQGKLALSCHLLPKWYTPTPHHLAEEQNVAEVLDELHLDKVRMADEILVIDIDGYIGESTAREIALAESLGIPVRRLSQEVPGWLVTACFNFPEKSAEWVVGCMENVARGAE